MIDASQTSNPHHCDCTCIEQFHISPECANVTHNSSMERMSLAQRQILTQLQSVVSSLEPYESSPRLQSQLVPADPPYRYPRARQYQGLSLITAFVPYQKEDTFKYHPFATIALTLQQVGCREPLVLYVWIANRLSPLYPMWYRDGKDRF